MKFLHKNLGRIFAAALLSLGLFAGLKSISQASTSNPTLDQTSYKKNINYVWVHNQDDVDHEAGSVCIWVASDDATYDGVSVSTTATANVVRVAGVVPVGQTLRAGKFGSLQVSGYHPSVQTTGTVNAGDVLVTSTTGEKAAAFTLATSTTTVGADFGVFGVAIDAADSNLTETILKIQ
jgi:hypothetical protein